ncbi:MAG: 50S ribosomal protein L3 N(5)-glutamine methyltransferase [Salinisphaeraceae bacterium]|jgi:ribosomal protein L3 glutamine methyltransferase|nr:50S ribosomal protein L3 N(5)-glutamine methyltransferase [Salinisphaeraceae bacterium]
MYDTDDLTGQLHSLRDYIRWGASRFARAGLAFGHGCDNALDEAAHLAFRALQLDFDLPETYLDARITRAEGRDILDLFDRRITQREPAAYLTGLAHYAGLDFEVCPDVLVPRSPVAELIESGFEPWISDLDPERILDLCTGCGAIGILCALRFPYATVDLTDLSPAAVAVARRNIERHDLPLRVRAIESDLFDAVDAAPYDLIITNPPYIGSEEMAGLAPEYRHEPEVAFFGGDDGMDIVARILEQAGDHLQPDGLLVFEVGFSAFLFEQRWPDLPVTWVELERGGVGVGVIQAEELRIWREQQGAEPAAAQG